MTFVAFGGEEPRGPGDDEHHFGSQSTSPGCARTPRSHAWWRWTAWCGRGPVPVCTGGLSPPRVRRELLAAADRVGVRTRACVNRTSDHWPFEKAGRPVARLGGNDYRGATTRRGTAPGSSADRSSTGSVAPIWEWLRTA